jgi:acyl-CoA thioester hydrolase
MLEPAALATGPWIQDRVRWSDVDKMGIVYYGRYLRFMEAAEAELFRMLGFPYDTLSEELGVWIARVRVEIDFLAPARLDDEIACRAEVRKVGGSSLTLRFPIDRADGTHLAEGVLVLAALDRETLRPVRLPARLAGALRGD